MSDLNPELLWNKQKAYSGTLGSERERFCREYTAEKAQAVKSIEDMQLRETDEKKTSITCEKGCRFSTCCMEYIEATIQECEAIVYYLYNHEEALEKFIQNYPKWRQGVSAGGEVHEEFDKIYKTFLEPQPQAKPSSMRVLAQYDAQYYELHIKYFDQHLMCPFSYNNECLIYDARPFNCACSYSTSPVDLCALSDRMLPPVNRSTPPEDSLDPSFYHGEIRGPRAFFMPLYVYEILVNGYKQISRMTGIVEIEKEAVKQRLIYEA